MTSLLTIEPLPEEPLSSSKISYSGLLKEDPTFELSDTDTILDDPVKMQFLLSINIKTSCLGCVNKISLCSHSIECEITRDKKFELVLSQLYY